MQSHISHLLSCYSLKIFNNWRGAHGKSSLLDMNFHVASISLELSKEIRKPVLVTNYYSDLFLIMNLSSI